MADKVITDDHDFAPYTVGGSVYVSHAMNGDRCRGMWRLLKFLSGGRGFHCRTCDVYIDESSRMFKPIMEKFKAKQES